MKPDLSANDFRFFPRVFLVGAPRSGTTSIGKLLSRHPEIWFSRPKEINYFYRVSADGLGHIQHDYLDRHFAHFDPAQHGLAAEG